MKLLIDCDPGVDDALALILAGARTHAEVLAVTTVAGNVGVDACTRNARFVLSLVGLDMPVSTGARAPLRKEFRDASETHGDDGLGNISRLRRPDGSPVYALPSPTPQPDEAVDAIIGIIRDHPGEVTLVATGPLTNLARVAEREPPALDALARLVIMGGAYHARGNVTPWAEYNFWVDPDAAAVVLAQPVEKTLVGLDVTHQVVLSREMVEEEIRALGTPLARFVADATREYAAFDSRTYGVRGNFVHDVVALAAALEPDVIGTEPMCVRVETEGGRAGACIVEDGPPNAHVAVSVDGGRALSMLLKAIAAGKGRWMTSVRR